MKILSSLGLLMITNVVRRTNALHLLKPVPVFIMQYCLMTNDLISLQPLLSLTDAPAMQDGMFSSSKQFSMARTIAIFVGFSLYIL